MALVRWHVIQTSDSESVPLLPLELVPSILHHVHSCLYPEDCCVFGFPGTESPKYVWPEIPGPGEYSGQQGSGH